MNRACAVPVAEQVQRVVGAWVAATMIVLLVILIWPAGAASAAIWESGDTWLIAPGGSGRQPLAEVYPSSYEQYLVELVNRARANPLAEVARTGLSDLNEGLSPGTITSDAKQPLAIHLMLTDAAGRHSQWMIDTDTFSHYEPSPRVEPGDRMTAAGYSFVGSWICGENIAIYMSYPSAPDTTTAVAYLHDGLFVDENYDGRGHRVNIMNPTFKEIGSGVATGLFFSTPYNWQSVACTEDFAMSSYLSGDSFITGVAYNDTLVTADSFYTPGEGLAGVTVTAVRQSDSLTRTMTTWPSGGYSLRVPPGTYTVYADIPCVVGGGGGGPIYDDVVVGTQNVKCDFLACDGQPLELSATVDQAWVYQNTAVTTLDRHQCLLTVSVTGGFFRGLPGQAYALSLTENGSPITHFQVSNLPSVIMPGTPEVIQILGGRRDTTTPGSYTLRVTVTGSPYFEEAERNVPLVLRHLADIDGDGAVTATDNLEMNKALNGLATLPGIGLRELDLTGDGATVNAEDKLVINQILNGLVVP